VNFWVGVMSNSFASLAGKESITNPLSEFKSPAIELGAFDKSGRKILPSMDLKDDLLSFSSPFVKGSYDFVLEDTYCKFEF
jgi:hypothetical protein